MDDQTPPAPVVTFTRMFYQAQNLAAVSMGLKKQPPHSWYFENYEQVSDFHRRVQFILEAAE